MEEKVNYRGGNYYSSLLEQARGLRKKQTKAEKIFWELVRRKKFLGLKFRRQHQIDRFIVDFFCASKNLIIEIDGKIHINSEQHARDIARDQYLNELGFEILRFSNEQIFYEIENVKDEIMRTLTPDPSPIGRGEKSAR